MAEAIAVCGLEDKRTAVVQTSLFSMLETLVVREDRFAPTTSRIYLYLFDLNKPLALSIPRELHRIGANWILVGIVNEDKRRSLSRLECLTTAADYAASGYCELLVYDSTLTNPRVTSLPLLCNQISIAEYSLLSNIARAQNRPLLATQINHLNRHILTNYFDKADLYTPLYAVPPLDFSSLTAEFDYPTFSDFSVICRNKPIYLHKAILSIKSQYWADILRYGPSRVVMDEEYNVARAAFSLLYGNVTVINDVVMLKAVRLRSKWIDVWNSMRDIDIEIGGDVFMVTKDRKVFGVNSFMLRSFSNVMQKVTNGRVHVDIKLGNLKCAIYFMYTGTFNLKDQKIENVWELVMFWREFQLPNEFFLHLVNLFSTLLTSSNVLKQYQKAIQIHRSELKEVCEKYLIAMQIPLPVNLKPQLEKEQTRRFTLLQKLKNMPVSYIQ